MWRAVLDRANDQVYERDKRLANMVGDRVARLLG